MKQFLAAIRFLTILPLPGDWGAAESDLAGSVPFFPVVGLLLGGLAAALAWGLARIAPPMVAAESRRDAIMAPAAVTHPANTTPTTAIQKTI